jgi:hypothetical protein
MPESRLVIDHNVGSFYCFCQYLLAHAEIILKLSDVFLLNPYEISCLPAQVAGGPRISCALKAPTQDSFKPVL